MTPWWLPPFLAGAILSGAMVVLVLLLSHNWPDSLRPRRRSYPLNREQR
jgi:hypothetical protein